MMVKFNPMGNGGGISGGSTDHLLKPFEASYTTSDITPPKLTSNIFIQTTSIFIHPTHSQVRQVLQ
jgi:hypothetical protein